MLKPFMISFIFDSMIFIANKSKKIEINKRYKSNPVLFFDYNLDYKEYID